MGASNEAYNININNDPNNIFFVDYQSRHNILGVNPFSTETTYKKGDYVLYENSSQYYLYRFTADKSAGAWDSSKVEVITICKDLASSLSALGITANKFSSSQSYNANDYVLYSADNIEYKLYKFTSAKSAGAWDSSKVTETKIVDNLGGGGGGGSVDYTQLIAKLQSEYNVETFDAEGYYSEGDYVVNNNKTYICTTDYEASGTFSDYFSEMSPEAVLADLAYKNINKKHPLIEMWQNSSFNTSDTYTHSFTRNSRNWPTDLYKYRTLKFIYYEEDRSGNDITIKNMAVLTMPNYLKTLSETSGDKKYLMTNKFMKCDVGSLNTQGTESFTLALKDLIAADGEYIDLHISLNGDFYEDDDGNVIPEIGVSGSFTRYKATCDASNNITFTKYNPEDMNMYLIFDDYSKYSY